MSRPRGGGVYYETMKPEMSQEKHSRHAVLSETTTFDRNSGDLRIVIETPKGSRNKYKYEPECHCLELTNVLPEGVIFPYDFDSYLPPSVQTAIHWMSSCLWTHPSSRAV